MRWPVSCRRCRCHRHRLGAAENTWFTGVKPWFHFCLALLVELGRWAFFSMGFLFAILSDVSPATSCLCGLLLLCCVVAFAWAGTVHCLFCHVDYATVRVCWPVITEGVRVSRTIVRVLKRVLSSDRNGFRLSAKQQHARDIQLEAAAA